MSTTVKLSGDDCCLVVRDDGRIEVVGPDPHGGEMLTQLAILHAMAEHLGDEEFCQEMVEYMTDDECQCTACRPQAAGLLN